MTHCDNQLNFPVPIQPVFNPLSIVNPNYVDDPFSMPSGFSIKIYIDTTPYEFTKFYWAKTMTIEENRGFERGKSTFYICDYDFEGFNLPFLPLVEQKIEIWNLSEDDLFFSGRITNVETESIVRREDGTEVQKIKVEAFDRTQEFEYLLISESFANVTTTFIAKVIIDRYTGGKFNTSAIDTTKGFILADFRINQQYIGNVLQRLLDIEQTFTFWVNPTNNQVYFGEKTDILNNILNITEDTVYDYFLIQDINLGPDMRVLRNRVKFFYNSKFNEGTVNVTTGSNVVFGTNTNWDINIQEGATFRREGSTSVYSIQTINNSGEIILSSDYAETIETNVPYEISGFEAFIVVEDAASIDRVAQINNETGPYAGIRDYMVPMDSNPYTREEARQIAKSHLLKYSNPLIKGRGTTDNDRLSLAGLHAGQVIHFDLPISRKIIVDAVIQKLTRKDLGGLLDRVLDDPLDTRVDPLMEIEIDLEDRLFDFRNQIKRLMSDVRRGGISDTEVVRVDKTINERIFVYDCVDVTPPLGDDINSELIITDSVGFIPPVSFNEELIIDDDISFSTPPSGPFYTTPSPRTNGYVVGHSKFGAVS